MKPNKIINILVLYGGIPETCFTIGNESESQGTKKISNITTNLCKKYLRDNLSEEIIQVKITEIQSKLLADQYVTVGDYEIYLIESILV